MKIVLATHGTKNYFGIPKYTFLMARELHRRGVEVEVLVDTEEGRNKLREIAIQQSIPCTVIPVQVNGRPGALQFAQRVAKHLHKHNDFNILHTSHIIPFFYLMYPERRTVVFQPFGNEAFTLEGKGIGRAYCRTVAQPVLYFCGHNADALASEGTFQHDDMSRWYNRKANEIRVIPVAVDTTSSVIKARYDHQAADGSRKCLITLVNGLYPYEDVQSAINALRKALTGVPYLRMVIVGSGPQEDRLRNQAQGLPVEFRKNIPEHDLRMLLAETDIFLCTTQETDYQMGLMEAAAAGVPILSTPKNWTPPDVVTAPRERLSDAIAQMAEWGEHEARIIGTRLHHHALQHYSFSAAADQAVRIYEEVLRRRRP